MATLNDSNTNNRWFYLSAYAIAVKHGYQGSEAQFVDDLMKGAAYAKAAAEEARDEALRQADLAGEKALDAEAYGAGTRAGTAVEEGDAAYENNASYYAGQAGQSAQSAAESAEAAEASETAAKDYADHIGDPVSSLVTDWLEANITQEEGYVIDAALKTEGAAADAKFVGGALRRASLSQIPFVAVNGTSVDGSEGNEGEIKPYNPDATWGRTTPIRVDGYSALHISTPRSSNYNAFYDGTLDPDGLGNGGDALISMFRTGAGDSVVQVPEGAVYCILSNKYTGNADPDEDDSVDRTVIYGERKMSEETREVLAARTLRGWSAESRWFYRLNGESAVLEQATVGSGVEDWQYLVVPCEPGEKFTVTGTGSSNPRAWGFTDKDPEDETNSILACEGYHVSVEEKVVTAPEDAAYLIVNRRTSLVSRESFRGVTPAGAEKELAMDVEALKRDNSVELWTPVDAAETTQIGVTYATENGVVTISGTAESGGDPAPSIFNLINTNGGADSPPAIPDWAELGGTYYIDPRKTGADDAIIRVNVYDDDGAYTILYGSDRPGLFTIPEEDVHHMIVRIYVRPGAAVDCTMSPVIRTAPTNLELYDVASRGINVRVMQNNIGKFRWGYSAEYPDAHGMSEEKYQEVLSNYKRFYGQYRPDILCLQEYVNGMDKAQTHDPAEVLFGPLYPYASAAARSPKIFAAADVSSYLMLTFTGTDEEETAYATRPVRAHLTVGSKRVAVITGALEPPPGNWKARAEEWTQILEYLDGYDYAIAAFDLNPQPAKAGETRPEEVGDTASSELQYLLSIAAEHGFTAGNGGYWGTSCTYVKHSGGNPGAHYDPTADIPLDNILVKGNIKIRNFEVLGDWYEDLASDHVPVIADLFIY